MVAKLRGKNKRINKSFSSRFHDCWLNVTRQLSTCVSLIRTTQGGESYLKVAFIEDIRALTVT